MLVLRVLLANTTPNGVVERTGGVVSSESLEAGGSGYKPSPLIMVKM